MQRNKKSLFRRLAAAAVGAAMLLSLAACSKAPEEPTLPPHLILTEPTATQPQPTEPPVTETLPTQPVETTAPKVEIDYENLVTDAFVEVVHDEYGSGFCYHIPQFNLPDDLARKINQKIYDAGYALLTSAVYPSMQEYGCPDSDGMRYLWGYQGDLACILVEDMGLWDCASYDSYTISLTTGREVSMEELLAAFGMDREAFYDLVHERLKLYWDEWIEQLESNGNGALVNDEFFKEQMVRTLTYENVHNAIPYINPDGGLSFVAEIFSIAGGDSYMHLINAEGTLEADEPKCNQKHPSSNPIPTDDPLEYFIENCDRHYFTKADIQSFDEQMCLYARNAIYAKSGWIFSSANLRSYFEKYSWYRPRVTADEFTEDLLNSYQIANRDLIVNHENGLKGENPDTLQYFIENCDHRYFTAAEIADLDEEELVYARNAIYAKSGRIFSMEKLANYFQKYSWYTPSIPAEDFSEDMLNKYQTANRDLIVARENSLKGITPEQAYVIACEYWDYQEGDIAEETGFELYLYDDGTVEHNGTLYYAFRLRWQVVDESGSSWMSTVDQVYINARTGECSYSIYD